MSFPRWTTSTVARLNYLRLIIAVAYICGILLSFRLWFGLGRTFPRAPILSSLPPFIFAHDYLLSMALLAALMLSAISAKRRYTVIVIALTVLLAALDLNRLQPWVFQYAIMLAALACVPSNGLNQSATSSILAANQLVVCALYFWSGAQKLNWSFGHEVLPNLLQPAGIHFPSTVVSWLPVLGFGVAICVMLIGIGLLWRRTRKVALATALLMHLLLLLLLIAAWRNYVIWPWNVAMMTMVLLLFRRSDESILRAVMMGWRKRDLAIHFPRVVFLVCGILPALSFAGCWDLYLSGVLYAGNAPVAVMRITEATRNQLPVTARHTVFTDSRGEFILPFYEWSMNELHVPPYPEVRVYRQMARQLCATIDHQDEIQLIVRERPALVDGTYKVTRTNCGALIP